MERDKIKQIVFQKPEESNNYYSKWYKYQLFSIFNKSQPKLCSNRKKKPNKLDGEYLKLLISQLLCIKH